MRKLLVLLGVMVPVLLLVDPRPGEGQAAPGEEAQAVRNATAAYTAAFNKGDEKGVDASWAVDGEYVDEAGKVTKGREAIAALFRPYFTEKDLKGSKMEIAIDSLRVIKGDVALQDGIATITAPDGAASRTRYASVWSKVDGKWLIHSARDLPYGGDESASSAASSLKDLEWLVGQWEGDKGNVNITVRWALDRKFLEQEYKAKRGDTDLTVKQFIGFDPLTGQLKSWYFDSRGNYGEGLWERDGNSWLVQTAGVLSTGLTGTGRNVFRFVDDQSFIFQSKDREIEGQPIPDAAVTLTRKPATK